MLNSSFNLFQTSIQLQFTGVAGTAGSMANLGGPA